MSNAIFICVEEIKQLLIIIRRSKFMISLIVSTLNVHGQSLNCNFRLEVAGKMTR